METAKALFTIGVKHPAPPEDPRELLRTERLMTLLCETLFSRSGDFYSSLFESGTVSPGMSYGSSVGRSSLAQTAGSYGYFYLSGECDSPEAVYAAFLDYIASVKGDGLDPAALDRARRTLYADYIYGFDSTEGVASSLMTAALDGVGLYDLSDLDQSLTEAELTALLSEAFEDTQYTLSSVMPNE
jgi:predicted Zn-dependent peptidase